MAILANTEFGILRLTISRPQKRNSINSEMFDMLTDALAAAARDSDVRVVLLEGDEQIFSAGADLEQVAKNPEEVDRAAGAFFEELQNFPKPIVARVNGPAVGAAFAMLLYCDMVYASEKALFSIPAVALARTPRFGTVPMMCAAAGHARTAEKLLLSEPITAQEAFDMHLLTAVFDDETLPNAVAAKVARLAVLPPGAVQATKTLLLHARELRLQGFAVAERSIYDRQAESGEAHEALDAFLTGRKPVFKKTEEA